MWEAIENVRPDRIKLQICVWGPLQWEDLRRLSQERSRRPLQWGEEDLFSCVGGATTVLFTSPMMALPRREKQGSFTPRPPGYTRRRGTQRLHPLETEIGTLLPGATTTPPAPPSYHHTCPSEDGRGQNLLLPPFWASLFLGSGLPSAGSSPSGTLNLKCETHSGILEF